MNVLISSISIKDQPTGVFSRSFNLAKGLVREGNKVTLLTTDTRRSIFYRTEERNGVKIVSFPIVTSLKINRFGYSVFNSLLRLYYIIFKKYDIVHADQHRPVSFIVCYIYRLFYHDAFLICDWQDVFGRTGMYDYKSKIWKLSVGPFDNLLEIFSIKNSDAIIVLSEALYKQLQIRGKDKNIYKLWGGGDTDSIKFPKSYIHNRHKFNINPDEFVIIFAGLQTLDYENNIKIFKVLKELRNRGLKIVLAKTGRNFSPSFIKKNEIGDEIIEVGYIKKSEYGDFLSCANVFMLVQIPNTNNLSRWPNVIGDYLFAGRPIIMDPIGELIELKEIFPAAVLDINHDDEKELIVELTNIYGNSNEFIKSYEIIADYAEIYFSWTKSKRIELYIYSYSIVIKK